MINCNESTCHCAGQYWLFGNYDVAEDYEFGIQYRKRVVEFMKTGQVTDLKSWHGHGNANLINKDSTSIYDFENCDELDLLESYAKV